MKTLRKAHSEVKPLSDLALISKRNFVEAVQLLPGAGAREGRQREGGEAWGWGLDFLVMITSVV